MSNIIDLGAVRARLESAPAMQELRRLVARVAPAMINVLLLGETGVGKEVLAAAIHRASPRNDQPFLRLNCAALSETLLESELFGHERGAFTGAVASKQGLLETADGGTVFLDEIGELPLSIQAKLLRVIEERVVLSVGAVKPKVIDVRFIAATNRDLDAEVARGRFRQDLFYRLDGISLVIPPLRERLEEIAGLVRGFVAEMWHKLEHDSPPPRLSQEALGELHAHAWPGNIRELRNVIERAVLLCTDGTIRPEHLLVGGRQARRASSSPTIPYFGVPTRESQQNLAESVKREVAVVERRRIVAALERCNGNQTQAAKLLGISRATLVSRLELYDIDRPRKART
jgi:transcriptional regulator with PAS, ATPase and Fis domain